MARKRPNDFSEANPVDLDARAAELLATATVVEPIGRGAPSRDTLALLGAVRNAGAALAIVVASGSVSAQEPATASQADPASRAAAEAIHRHFADPAAFTRRLQLLMRGAQRDVSVQASGYVQNMRGTEAFHDYYQELVDLRGLDPAEILDPRSSFPSGGAASLLLGKPNNTWSCAVIVKPAEVAGLFASHLASHHVDPAWMGEFVELHEAMHCIGHATSLRAAETGKPGMMASPFVLVAFNAGVKESPLDDDPYEIARERFHEVAADVAAITLLLAKGMPIENASRIAASRTAFAPEDPVHDSAAAIQKLVEDWPSLASRQPWGDIRSPQVIRWALDIAETTVRAEMKQDIERFERDIQVKAKAREAAQISPPLQALGRILDSPPPKEVRPRTKPR